MSDPTRFDLDDRQRAMLAEMGVRVWWPSTSSEPAGQIMPAAPVPEPAPVPVAAPVAAPSAASHASQTLPVAKPAPVAAPMPTAQALVAGVDRMDWPSLQRTVAECQACELCTQRKQAVLGGGDVQARWMVVGEAPGEEEDQQGQPFVGQSGQLLDNMLKAVGLSRQAQGEAGVYIANALKCRPPGNRNPSAQELATCAPYLARQVALVQPRIILAMGRFAVQTLLQTTEPLGKLRGQVHAYQGVPVVVTYHPAYLLRIPADKGKA